MSLRRFKKVDLGTFTADGETGMSSSADFRTSTVTIITTGFTGTLNFAASNAERTGTPPDLSAAASDTNEFALVQSIDLQTGDPVSGAAGVPFTADTSVSRFEINDNNNNFIGVQLSSVSAGSVIIRLDMVDNQ